MRARKAATTWKAAQDLGPRASLWPWCIWGLGVVFYGYNSFQRVSPSVMVNELMRDFAATAVILGNLSAVFFYSYALVQVPVGVLVDRFGPRRTMAAAAAVGAVGCILFGSAPSLSLAYVGRLLIGATSGFAWVATLQLAMLWLPPERFALASGLTLFIGMMCAVGAQAPTALVVDAIGWRWTMVLAGVFGLVLAVVIWIVARGQGSAAASRAAAQEARRSRGSMLAGLRQVVASPQNWLIAVYWGAVAGPMLAFAGLWGVPYLMVRYGLARPAAAALASSLLVGWAIGGPLSGWLSDRIHRRKLPILVGTAASLLTWTAFFYLPGLTIVHLYALLITNGIASGAGIINVALAREQNPAAVSGTVQAVINVFSPAAGAVCQLLIGFLLDANWAGASADGIRLYSTDAYLAAYAVFPVSLVIALVVAFAFRETYCRALED
jgi:MFS family permease